MSRTRKYHQQTIDTISRFYEVFDDLLLTKKIKSINSFCDQYQIDKRNLYAQREDLNRGYFEVFWISVLIQNYNASAKYLLFGSGKMFTK
jgi:hypothetical protein